MAGSDPAARCMQVDPETSFRMSRVRRRDTKPELLVRAEAHRRGLRYRVDRRPIPSLRSRADLVFTRAKLAVFIDGCFWHRCPEHYVAPKNNADWWAKKIEGNVRRDRATDEALRASGWTVVRAWEHDDPATVVDRIEAALDR